MITRVEIDGFKTFQNFALDLEPLTIIAGPNSAGKSNLFDGLQLLSRLAETGLTAAFQSGRGRIRDQFSWFRGEPGRFIKLAVELLVADQGNGHERLEQTRLRYEVLIQRRQEPDGTETLLVAGEQLTAIAKDSDKWIAAHPQFASFARYGTGELLLDAGLIHLTLGDGPDLQENHDVREANIYDDKPMRIGKDFRESTVLCSHGVFGKHVSAVQRELLSWRFPVVDVAKLRNPSEPGFAKVLASDGSNLPTVLSALPKNVAASIQVDLADLVAGVQGFEVALPRGEQLCIEVAFTDGEKVPARILSDGTLRILAFLTQLRSAHPGSVIAHEEPETGIYPGRLTALLDKLVAATEPVGGLLPAQVVLNTHSPVVLSILRRRPSAVVLADKVSRTEQGTVRRFTRMRHVAPGESADRGATLASRREAERLLEIATVDERP